MTKRTVTSVLWLLAIWTVGNIASAFVGAPAILGPAGGLLVATLVWWDPAGWLWTRRTQSAAARRRIADLARTSESRRAPELRREVDSAHS